MLLAAMCSTYFEKLLLMEVLLHTWANCLPHWQVFAWASSLSASRAEHPFPWLTDTESNTFPFSLYPRSRRLLPVLFSLLIFHEIWCLNLCKVTPAWLSPCTPTPTNSRTCFSFSVYYWVHLPNATVPFWKLSLTTVSAFSVLLLLLFSESIIL